MAFKSLGLLVLSFFMLTTVSSAQEPEILTITNMKVEPSTVSSGGKVVISCQVSHPLGPIHIEKVAATTFYGNWVTAYPELYDCLLYTSPSPRDRQKSRMPSSA